MDEDMKKMLKEAERAGAWLRLYCVIAGNGFSCIREAARLADLALEEYDKRWTKEEGVQP